MYEAEMKLHYMHAPRIICLINRSTAVLIHKK